MIHIEMIKKKLGKDVEFDNGMYRVLMDKKTGRTYDFSEDDDINVHMNILERSMLLNGARYNKEGKLITQGANLTGRQAGVKNKTTLFKEAMREGFEEVLEREGMKVFMATVQRAIGKRARDEETGELLFDESGNPLYEGGSDVASKMILDRIVPVADVEKTDLNKFNISITVRGMEPKVEVMDGEYEEIPEEGKCVTNS